MIGTTVSHYKILEKLGEGGMGVVYKAQDTKLDRLVALKFLPPQASVSQEMKDRFMQEAKAAAALNHTNICTVYGVEEHDGQMFISMEYIEGGTLRQKLPYAKLDDAVSAAIQVGDALYEAHSKGIVHRDIKADNVMLTSRGQVKVMDFGLAKLKGSLKLTKTSSTVGTLAYMAPEQIQGGEVDARSDIFSFGVLLFEMLTGRLPFRGEHDAAMMYSIVNEQPDPIEKYLPEASSEFLHIFNRALEKDPEDRYQTVHDMVIDLRRLKKETSRVSRLMPNIQPSQSSSESTSEPSGQTLSQAKKSWKWMALGGIVILAIAVSAILLLWHPREIIDSLAVLPFSYKGDDANVDILADEIPGALVEKLNGLANIKVKSRSTTLRYRNSQKEPPEIGKELGVHAVLTGSVELRDQTIIVTIELSDVNEGIQLWGPHTYKEKLSDMYVVQEKIVRDVTEQLRIKVSGAEQEKLAKRSTENAEAYKDYLLGLHFRYIETPEGSEKAISYFRLAIEKDPTHALAYAGLAEAYFLRAIWVYDFDLFRQSTAAAQRAFELDPKLPETNIALGIVRECEQLDWSGAEQLFRSAIELNPNHWNAHRELGLLFYRMGRFEEAKKEALRTLELETLAQQSYALLGAIYSCTGKHLMAADQFKKGSELDFQANAEALGWEYLTLGKYEQARDVFMKAQSPMIACYYTAVGRTKDVVRQIDTLQRMAKQGGAWYLTIIYSYMGENSKALDQLESYMQMYPLYVELKVNPFFSKLHSEPRFTALVKKLGIDK